MAVAVSGSEKIKHENIQPMIVVSLKGGLGNQMFQYAAGRALAFRHNSELVLDASFYFGEQLNCTSRVYQLDHLQIGEKRTLQAELAVDTDVSLSFFGRLKTAARNLFRPTELKLCRFRERSYLFDPDFFKLPDSIYLDGYWQSERYFNEVSDIIRMEFVPASDVSGKNSDLLREIQATNSVSVHVRRGDYVTSPQIASVHGLCEPGYYHACMKEISRCVYDPHFFLFSDDTDWVKRNLSVQFPHTVVDHNTLRAPVEDLRLMSLCKHNIIANSSFSWWGAWLNNNPSKVVFAPEQWFAAEELKTDIVPERWRRQHNA